MLADLVVLVPSRGRPENLARLISAVHETAQGKTHVVAGVDLDDPRLEDYRNIRLPAGDQLHVNERMNLVQYTNYLAQSHIGKYRYCASLGDDMVPRTRGWDVKLMSAIEEDFGGTGITYPWDGIRDDIPEAYVLSCDIPSALGWVMEPSLQHFWNDNVIADLGHGAGCIRQLRGVVIEHLNVGAGKAVTDQTALDNGTKIAADQAAYQVWRRERMLGDTAVLRDLRIPCLSTSAVVLLI